MSFRSKWILAAPLLAVLASACTDDVTQESSGTMVQAVFDSNRSILPTPNDLVLNGAPNVLTTTTRLGLFSLIGAGGFAPDPSAAGVGPLSVINIPYEIVADGVATTASGQNLVDPATISSNTVAIIRLTGDATRFDPFLAGDTGVAPGATTASIKVLPFAPAPGNTYPTGSRWVVALRGGPNGVKTLNGRELRASTAMYLVAQTDVDFKNPEARPSILPAADAARLDSIRTSFLAPLDWDAEPNLTTCRAAVPIPPTSPGFTSTPACWLPKLPPVTDPSVLRAAFGAIDALAWPRREAVSIQTFEIAPDAL